MAIWTPNLTGRRGPKYLRIVDALAEDIASGALQPGARLPPHRLLAYALNVSPNTTSRAYAEGVARALINGEVGRGTFVRAPGASAPGVRAPGASLLRDDTDDVRRPGEGPIDLSRNLPCRGGAATALAETLTALGEGRRLQALTDDQSTFDVAHHTQAAVAWLARCGVTADGHEVVITNGGQHGIWCTLMAVTEPGDLLLTEALTYAPIKAMADRLALKLKPVPLDAEGLCPDALEALCRGHAAKALYLTPTLQTPTTATMGPERRARVVEIVDQHGLLLIEDDVFGVLKPDRPSPIAALAPGCTVYVTSTSKGLAPGLRVGFVRAPASIAQMIQNAVSLTCWMPAPLMVEITAQWLADGTVDRLTTWQRAQARRRQSLAQTILAGDDLRADTCGLHLWLVLPKGVCANAVTAEAATRGVKIIEGATFAIDPAARPNAVRLCLSHEPDEHRLARGLEIVRTVVRAPSVGPSLVL